LLRETKLMLFFFTNIITYANKYPVRLILTIYLIVQLILFWQTGVVTGLEAKKYIDEGTSLHSSGTFSASKYIFYLPVILLVYVCRLFSFPIESIVIVNVALGAIATIKLYETGKLLGYKAAGIMSSVVLAAFYPIQIWNMYLYSDSIFISLSIIYIWAVLRFGKNGYRGLFIILTFLVILIFSRPNGLLFLPPTLIYLLFKKQPVKLRTAAFAITALSVTAFFFLLNNMFKGGADFDIIKPYAEEHIICFVPSASKTADIDIVNTSQPLNDLYYYITHNPGHFFKLWLKKIYSFFNLTRNYYSGVHNLYLLVMMIPIYFLSIPGLIKLKKTNRDYFIFILSFLLFYPAAICMQCDDWHSRFTMGIMPVLILLAVMGLLYIKQLMKKYNSTNQKG
jgi:4-amino-4-deoxy-L-arabinose transferase-like glycosyltransferase